MSKSQEIDQGTDKKKTEQSKRFFVVLSPPHHHRRPRGQVEQQTGSVVHSGGVVGNRGVDVPETVVLRVVRVEDDQVVAGRTLNGVVGVGFFGMEVEDNQTVAALEG